MTRMRHPDTGAVVEVAESATPIMAKSGWVELSADECAELDRKRMEDARARDAAMTPTRSEPVAAAPVAPAPAVPVETAAPRRQDNTKKEGA